MELEQKDNEQVSSRTLSEVLVSDTAGEGRNI